MFSYTNHLDDTGSIWYIMLIRIFLHVLAWFSLKKGNNFNS